MLTDVGSFTVDLIGALLPWLPLILAVGVAMVAVGRAFVKALLRRGH